MSVIHFILISEPPEKDTFRIYQLKRGEDTRELQFESYDRLKESGQILNPDNYVKVKGMFIRERERVSTGLA